MKTPKKETKEVINEAVKETTGKSIEDLQKQVQEKEKEISEEFLKEYKILCAKYNRKISISPANYIIEKVV